jgi:osmotically-inducible protein OsmY
MLMSLVTLTTPCLLPVAAAGATGQSMAGDLPRTARAVAPTDRPALSDRLVADAVADELATDPRVDLNWIEVVSRDGRVTLSGTADNLLAQRRAERIARTVRGVQSVANTITVPVSDRSGSDIAADIESALLFNVATDAYEVDVRADAEGRVTLGGAVDSHRERELAERVAASIRGVTLIDNGITLDLTEPRPDSALAQEIAESLRWSVRVDQRPVNVAVRDARVRLTGNVGSAAERERAIDLAWVAGVRDVDASELMVEDRDAASARTSERPADAELARAVRRFLRMDPLVDASDLRVSVDDGVATLRGSVDALQARRAAEITTEEVAGITRAKNRLRVRPTLDLTDTRIADRIERRLILDPWIDASGVTVGVNDGTVVLTGDVPDAFARSQATAVAAGVDGVTRVYNHTVTDGGSSIFLYDPWVDGWPRESMVFTPSPTPWIDSRSERRLREDVKSQMWWSPFVDSDQVRVEARGGIVTLTGTVDSDGEREAAIENAYDGGAHTVIDRLRVADES